MGWSRITNKGGGWWYVNFGKIFIGVWFVSCNRFSFCVSRSVWSLTLVFEYFFFERWKRKTLKNFSFFGEQLKVSITQRYENTYFLNVWSMKLMRCWAGVWWECAVGKIRFHLEMWMWTLRVRCCNYVYICSVCWFGNHILVGSYKYLIASFSSYGKFIWTIFFLVCSIFALYE